MMEQPETPDRAQLPDPKGALPIPAHRLGKTH